MAKLTLSSILTAFQSTTALNTNFTAIVNELTNKVVYRDEPSPMARDLDLNSNKITNLAAPAVSSDAARLADITAASSLTTSTASITSFDPAASEFDSITVQGALEELNAATAGNGASLIKIEDSAGKYTSDDVEGALAEIHKDAVQTLTNKTLDTPTINTPTINTPNLNEAVAMTATSTELNYNDGSTPTAVVASKTVVANSNGDVAFPDGKGMDFSSYTDGSVAGTATSQVLVDYEEGTWTPSIQDASDSDSESQTYTSRSGYYTKVGNLVTVTGVVSVSSMGTLSGSIVKIAGLPYTIGADSLAIITGTGLALGLSTGVSVAGVLSAATTAIQLQSWDVSTGVTNTTVAEMGTTPYITFSATYKV